MPWIHAFALFACCFKVNDLPHKDLSQLISVSGFSEWIWRNYKIGFSEHIDRKIITLCWASTFHCIQIRESYNIRRFLISPVTIKSDSHMANLLKKLLDYQENYPFAYLSPKCCWLSHYLSNKILGAIKTSIVFSQIQSYKSLCTPGIVVAICSVIFFFGGHVNIV